jgi:hypothetical protein
MADTTQDTLADALPREIERVKEVVKLYDEIGPAGAFGAMMIRRDIAEAERAIREGDTVAMLRIYPVLKEIES